jgi:hypothetical protein
MENQTYPRKVGDDLVTRRGEQLVVCSKVDMDDWQIQQNRKTVIYINDETWCVVGKEYSDTKSVRYLLDPWPEPLKEIPGRRIRYNEEYVKARNEAEERKKKEDAYSPILHHLRAFIGFLPSRVKSRIEADYGIPARSATIVSIVFELLLFFLSGAFLQIFTYGTMGAFELVVFVPTFIISTLALLIDLVMRYRSYLREDLYPLGAFEWLIRRKAFNPEDSKTRTPRP